MNRWRVAFPAMLSLAALAGCLPATKTELPLSTERQGQATDMPRSDDRLRPSDEEIAKAFQRATENQQPIEIQEATRDSDKSTINVPTPLPKKRPMAASAQGREQLFHEFLQWRKSRAQDR